MGGKRRGKIRKKTNLAGTGCIFREDSKWPWTMKSCGEIPLLSKWKRHCSTTVWDGRLWWIKNIWSLWKIYCTYYLYVLYYFYKTKGVNTVAIDKKNNFKRLAESRTNKILDSLVLLGNLSNTSYYDYSMDQIDEIFNVIEEEMKQQKMRFIEKDKKRRKKFRL